MVDTTTIVVLIVVFGLWTVWAVWILRHFFKSNKISKVCRELIRKDMKEHVKKLNKVADLEKEFYELQERRM